MVLINKALNEVTVKLVYYGPGLCGKTTNLEKIYGNPKLQNKGKMISMSTETDRTLFFDFMPMELGTIAGQKVRVQLYTVPGQVFYDATRKLVLRGADGVVFVADSQDSMRESNLQSLENLRTNLRINRLDPDRVPIVFQYNKRDLPNVSPVDEITEYLQPGRAPVLEAVAIQGTGVTATLRSAVGLILENLKNNVDTTLYEEAPLQKPNLSVPSGISASGDRSVTTSSAATDAAAHRSGVSAPPRAASGPAASPFDEIAVSSDAFEVDPAVLAAGAGSPFVMDTEPFAPDPEPFAIDSAIVSDGSSEIPLATGSKLDSEDAEKLLSETRDLIATLEKALASARRQERLLLSRLGN